MYGWYKSDLSYTYWSSAEVYQRSSSYCLVTVTKGYLKATNSHIDRFPKAKANSIEKIREK